MEAEQEFAGNEEDDNQNEDAIEEEEHGEYEAGAEEEEGEGIDNARDLELEDEEDVGLYGQQLDDN